MREPAVPKGWRKIERPEPPTWHYSYSNEASQNSLICETPNFPDAYDPKTQEYHVAYSDRMAGWDRERFGRACKIAGGVDQVWAYRLRGAVGSRLIEFAKVALNIEDREVQHVRVVHHFNVASGYSCPTVHAIVNKRG